MRVLLAICLVVTTSLVWAAEGAVPQPSVGGSVTGKILEVKLVENYTYLRLQTAGGEMWAAVVNATAKKGETVTVGNAIMMENFESKALKRTFKKIVFGTLGGSAATAPPTAAAPLSMYTGKKKLDQINDAPVARSGSANAMTVAEIVTQSTALKGKTVSVRGKVVKFNPEIMGVNWIHLRDGSGSEADGSNDLLVTTSATVKVGDVVMAEGVVAVDKDFGAGYSYKVLVEKATVQK
jgi:hypothetical protein